MKTSYYALANSRDGIAISRYPPAGWTGSYYADLAPNADLLSDFKQKKFAIEDYTKIYQQQLDKLDPQKVWSDLHALTNGEEQTLLCFEKPKAQLAVNGYEPHPNEPNL